MKPQTMKRFDCSKVGMLGNLVPLSDKQKAVNLREFKKEQRPASKPSDDPQFTAPYTIKFGRRTKRGFNGCKLDPAIRASILRKRALNEAFHATLKREAAGR